MPDIRSVRPLGDDDHDDDGGDFEPVLGTEHRRGRDPLAVRDLTATILAEQMRGVLLECSSTMHGASVLPADMGYQLCTQTLGSISTSLTEVLGQTGYAYLIPTLPTHDETTQTPMGGTRGRRQQGSSSTGSSRGRSRFRAFYFPWSDFRFSITVRCVVAICGPEIHFHSMTSIATHLGSGISAPYTYS